MMAPVLGSGSMPAWMTLVANFIEGRRRGGEEERRRGGVEGLRG
jgi:hypothetical protein